MILMYAEYLLMERYFFISPMSNLGKKLYNVFFLNPNEG